MIRNIWSVLCTKSITDVQSQNVTLVEVPEELYILFDENEKALNVLINSELVTYWERENENIPGNGAFRVRLKFPEGSPEPELKNEDVAYVDLTDNLRARVVMRVQTIPVFGPGIYRFFVEVQSDDDWQEVASIPLLVKAFEKEDSTGEESSES